MVHSYSKVWNFLCLLNLHHFFMNTSNFVVQQPKIKLILNPFHPYKNFENNISIVTIELRDEKFRHLTIYRSMSHKITRKELRNLFILKNQTGVVIKR